MPTTLITGAAKRIGATIATHLAELSHGLVLHYHQSQAEAEALAETLRTTHHAPRVATVQADLSDPANLGEFWSGLPPVTHLIHNAASFAREPFGEFTPAQLRHHLAVNLESPLILSQGFLQQLPANSQGSVTVIGDGGMGWSVSPNYFPYAVSKHAWASLIDLLAASLAPRARANLIALGPTLPGVLDKPDTFDNLTQIMPLQRTGTPDEVAKTVAWLLEQPTITGQIISLAGGLGLHNLRSKE